MVGSIALYMVTEFLVGAFFGAARIAERKRCHMDENTTSAAEVNLMKAEEYRDHPDAGENKIKKRRAGKKLALLIAAAVVVGVVAASVFQGVSWYRAKESGGAVSKEPISELEGVFQKAVVTVEPDAAVGASVTDVSGVVKNVMPAVVATNCKVSKVSVGYDFFGRGREQKEQSTSSGTGILIGQSERELFIVTNNHVIADAVEVTVEFCDKTTAVAEVKGVEENNDLAVVCVPFDGLSFETLRQIRLASLGSSDDLKMGEFVIAIGNALGYGQSVTVGYVSALDREVTAEGVTLDLIQVDAAISEVLPIINDLMNREQLAEGESAYLGIVGKDVDAVHSKSFHMPIGICVTKVGEDSPAERAGLHQGDIIVGINGRTVATMEEYLHVLGYTRGGTEGTLQLKVLENGSYVDKELLVVFGYRGEGEDQ